MNLVAFMSRFAMRRWAAILVVVGTLLLPQAARAQQSPSSAPSPPSASKSSATPAPSDEPQGNPDIRVWVNTKSSVYHCPGTHWYGATKSGEYMKQSEAQQKGFRPAYHRACK